MERWAAELLRGNADAAWDLFLDRYRRLIFATIRHFTTDADDVMDVFARVLEALREDDFRRIHSYLDAPDHRATFSTWLVTVIRHLTIDWIRQRDGRGTSPPAMLALPPLERRVYELVLVQRQSHVAAFELVRAGEWSSVSFREFLGALRAAYRAAGRRAYGGQEFALPDSTAPEGPRLIEEEERGRRDRLVAEVLETLPSEDRVLLQLYVVEGVSADAVARVVGLGGAKAVYNRVYRLMAQLRPRLQAAGLGPAEP